MAVSIFNKFNCLYSTLTSVAMQRQATHNKSRMAGNKWGERKQLLIDVSVIAQSDGRTGIQRVVRNIYLQLLKNPPPNFTISPVIATRKNSYHYLPNNFLDVSEIEPKKSVNGKAVRVHSGDIFLGLDLAAHIIPHRICDLAKWRKQGVHMFFFVYDLLPLLEPSWFNSKTARNFRKWLRALAILADETICISNTVSKDLELWMQSQYGLRKSDIGYSIISLGANIQLTLPKTCGTESDSWLPPLGERTSLLIVGTIEPRKGHSDVLDAFEQLWILGVNANLVIAGKPGWKVDSLISRIRNHPELGKRLHWLNSPTDDVLFRVYKKINGLIMASKGEGFGLPLVEASAMNKPVLVRDIPIFREIAGQTATYFKGNSLVEDLHNWIKDIDSGKLIVQENPLCITWDESCKQLLKILSHAIDNENLQGHHRTYKSSPKFRSNQ